MTQPPPADLKMQRSSRDASTVPGQLATWLSELLPADDVPQVTLLSGADKNGMSSETLLFDVAWTEAGQPRAAAYVARVQPSADDTPVFPTYALREQYDAIRLVSELSDVPVPKVGFFEPTGDVLGMPFFVMERIDGVVPQDVMPYNFGDNWLFDASPEQQRALQDRSVGVLAGLHAIPDAATTFSFLDPARRGHAGPSLLARNLASARHWYEFAARDASRSPLIERSLAWLEAHVPAADDEHAVLTWGDSRIGNMMYSDFTPVAVLDWEMATLGPRQSDVSWMLFAHQVFESIAQVFGLPGMPDFMREEDVVAEYRRLTGYDLGDLTWFHIYNGLLWCIVFMRTGTRQVHFGEIERPDDIETLFHCKPLIERLLDRAGA